MLSCKREWEGIKTQVSPGPTYAKPCRALEKLQDQAQPQDIEDAKRVLEAELGQPFETLFAEFEPEARAAASLAQVI